MVKALRKINVPAAKPVVAKPAVQAPAPTAKVKLTKVGNVDALVAVKPRVAKPKAVRVEHAVASLYTGASPGLNKRKSRTVLDLALFNTNPEYILPERSELVAETIKKQYGNKPFPRANMDAGIIKHLLVKGFVEAVSGTGGEDTVLKFTRQGMSHSRKV